MRNKNLKKRIDIIGIVGLPACYGGFESLVQNLVDYQSQELDYTIFCSGKSYKSRQRNYKDAQLKYLPLKANGSSSIPYDILALMRSMFRKPDVVLVLGVSGCIFLPVFKLFSSAKVVTNIDGLEWRRDKWGKFAKWFLKFSEKIAVKYSDVIIADNKAISNYVLDEYAVNSNVIAYGGDHAIGNKEVSRVKDDYYFTVCRIEPENNIEMILEAFSQTTSHFKMVGNWNSSLYGRQLKERYNHFSNIELLEPIYDINVLFNYRSKCRGYIHGHSAGGTNPSLVEAMHFNTTIFAFDCDFNRYSTENSAFYFKNSKELLNLLEERSFNLHISEDEICANKLKKIADQRYTWVNVAKQYEDLY
jgi:glycosyltransferase involved in cell wall biosynthesis